MRFLQEHIDKNIEQTNDKTEKSRYVHLKTALNTLIKKNLVTEENIQFSLTVDIDNTVSALKDILDKEGKTDTRSPLTRVRRLAELYQSLNNIDYANSRIQIISATVMDWRRGEASC